MLGLKLRSETSSRRVQFWEGVVQLPAGVAEFVLCSRGKDFYQSGAYYFFIRVVGE